MDAATRRETTPLLGALPASPGRASPPAPSPGAARMERFHRRHAGTRTELAVWVCILLVSASLCLDESTSAQFDAFATSSFGRAAWIGPIATARHILAAVSKPAVARVADVASRHACYALVLGLYVAGHIATALAPSAATFAAARVASELGQAGLMLLNDVLIMDLTPLQYRSLAHAVLDVPFLVVPFLGSHLTGTMCAAAPQQATCWRYGYALYALTAPCLVLPVIWLLRRTAKTPRAPGTSCSDPPRTMARLRAQWHRIDFPGLTLLAASFSLVLLPLGLAWRGAALCVALLLGAATFAIFVQWERSTPTPVLDAHVWGSVLCNAVLIDVLYFASGMLRGVYLPAWAYVMEDWTTTQWGYFTALSGAGLTLCGLLAGVLQRTTHRYKFLQLGGLGLRLAGLGVTCSTAHALGRPRTLVLAQLLVAAGGAASVVGTRVAAQASVPHAHAASVMAQLSLWTKLGASAGAAAASATYVRTYRPNLLHAGLDRPGDDRIVDRIVASYAAARAYPSGSRERTAAQRAFTATLRPLWRMAFVLSIPPLVCAACMPNYHLGRTHNAVDFTDPAGRVIPGGESVPGTAGWQARGRDSEQEQVPEPSPKPFDDTIEALEGHNNRRDRYSRSHNDAE